VAALDAKAFQRLDGVALEARMVVRLVQEGYAVVSLGGSPQCVLRVRQREAVVVLEAACAGVRGEREVPMGEVPLKELHLEVAQKAVALLREVEARVPPPPPPPAALAAAPDAGPAPAPEPPAPPVEELPGRVSLRGGALVRAGGVDPFAALAWRFPLLGRLRGWLEGRYSASGAAGLVVQDAAAQAGLGFSLLLAPRLTLDTGLRLGVFVHTFRFLELAVSEPSGVRAELLATLPLELEWRVLERLVLGLHVAPGFTTRGRAHLVSGVPVYERGAFALELGLSLGVATGTR
jgi:hypothetical protein